MNRSPSSTSTPRVSVVIPTYNRADLLREALVSVADQTFRDYELIVVDDGSDDDTRAVVAATAPAARYVWLPRSGVSAARNRGAREARGEWIAFLDSDDTWLPRKLERQMAFVARSEEVEVLQCEEIWIRGGVRVNPGHRHRKPSGDIFLPSLDLCLVSPSAVVLRRARFERAGGFDEGLPACEDYDLWLRLAVDTQFHLLSEPLVVRRAGHADQLSRRYWGMDRFRVAALSRLILAYGLRGERRSRATTVLVQKCAVLAAGARRRGRAAEAARYEALSRFHVELESHGHCASRGAEC